MDVFLKVALIILVVLAILWLGSELFDVDFREGRR
jgi:hypothetical protein